MIRTMHQNQTMPACLRRLRLLHLLLLLWLLLAPSTVVCCCCSITQWQHSISQGIRHTRPRLTHHPVIYRPPHRWALLPTLWLLLLLWLLCSTCGTRGPWLLPGANSSLSCSWCRGC